MQIPPAAQQPNIQSGACPHGLPPALCPVCRGGGGAGAASSASKPKEWSYQKCYAAGLAIKAAAQRREDAAAFGEKQLLSSLAAEKTFQNMQNILNQFIQNIKLPGFQASFIQILNAPARLFQNAVNQFNRFISTASNMSAKVLNMLQQAGEKLANILGEIKNFAERKIFEDLKKKAKKIFSFCLSVIEDENYKNDDTLAVFKSRELRKYTAKILKKQKNDKY